MAEPQSNAGFGMIGLAMRVLHPSQGRMTPQPGQDDSLRLVPFAV